MQAVSSTKFSPLQLELLKVFSFQPTEDELKAVKVMLAKFFAHRLAEQANAAAKTKGITNEDLDAWLEDPAQ